MSKWLGLSSFQVALAADPYQNSAIPDEPRPPLLGLGADPRKYHMVPPVGLTHFLVLTLDITSKPKVASVEICAADFECSIKVGEEIGTAAEGARGQPARSC